MLIEEGGRWELGENMQVRDPSPRSSAHSTEDIRLAELLVALSLATDLAKAFPLEKGLRNSLLALLLGQELGLDKAELANVWSPTLRAPAGRAGAREPGLSW